jgi:hypothetical protein
MLKVKIIAFLLCIIIGAIILPRHSVLTKYPFYHNLYKATHYNDIIIYFYYIKRLSTSTYFLSYLHEHHYSYKPCNAIEHNNCIQIDSIIFFHQKIQTCLRTMIKTKSLQPILLLQQRLDLHDNLFMYELFLLIFTIHKQILLNTCSECSYTLTKTTLNTILEVSEKINQLPIAEVLNMIDMLVKELPPFLEKYELHSSIPWKAWFKKYWWVPPFFGAWFGLKILLSLQRPYLYYSPYLSPRPQIPLQPIITNDPALLEIRNGL